MKQARSVQDEKLLEAIFQTTLDTFPPIDCLNLIIDARPQVNAMGYFSSIQRNFCYLSQMAMGAGTENTDNYRGYRLHFAGIENIHVVRDSQNKLIDGFFF